jgi:hypothetical protein
MNGDTRVVSWKATEPEPDDVPSLEELRARERALGLNPETDPEADRIRQEMHRIIRRIMGDGTGGNGELPDDTGKQLTPHELKQKADAVAAEHAAVQVAEFPC